MRVPEEAPFGFHYAHPGASQLGPSGRQLRPSAARQASVGQIRTPVRSTSKKPTIAPPGTGDVSIVGSGVGSLQLRALEKEHATLQREHAAMSAAHGELQLTAAALRERNDQLVEMRDAAQALAAQNAAAAQASHVALEQLRAQKEEQERAAREEALSHFARSAELERRLNDSQMEAARALEGERRALGRQQELEAEVTTLAAEAETSAGHLRRLCEERASSFSSRMDDLASSSSAGGSPAVGSRHDSPSGSASLPPIVGRSPPAAGGVPAPAARRGGPKRGGSGSYLLAQKGRPPSGGQRPALS